MLITGTCPGYKQELPVDNPGKRNKRLLVICDHCGLEKKLSAFQDKLRRQAYERSKRKQAKAEAELEAPKVAVMAALFTAYNSVSNNRNLCVMSIGAGILGFSLVMISRFAIFWKQS